MLTLVIICVLLNTVEPYVNSYPYRFYPDQWAQVSNYSFNYLSTEHSLKQKGGDLFAITTALTRIGYDIRPQQLNAYIVDNNGTHSNGSQKITYFPGSIINWEFFKEFGLQFQGEYKNVGQFLGQDRYDLTKIIAIAMVVAQRQVNNMTIKQNQFYVIRSCISFGITIYVYNPNDYQNDFVNSDQVINYIVFKVNSYNHNACTGILTTNATSKSCQELSRHEYESRNITCVNYITNDSPQSQKCYRCYLNHAFINNSLRECERCPTGCSTCYSNIQGNVKCNKCLGSHVKTKSGCSNSPSGCKQIYFTSSQQLKCISCYLSYHLDQEQNKCTLCPSNCMICNNSMSCLQCFPGFELFDYYDNLRCRNRSQLNRNDNCLQLYGRQPYQICFQCAEPYINSNGVCIDCLGQYFNHQFCKSSYNLRCSKINSLRRCIKCKDSYRQISFVGQNLVICIIDPYQKCRQYQATSYHCKSCMEGYYLNTSNICVPCQEGQYTIIERPYECFTCQPPSNDPQKHCQQPIYHNERCSCSQNVIHTILQIKASNFDDFFANSIYRQTKFYQSLAAYLNIEITSIRKLGFQFIQNGGETYHVFVGYIQLTVDNFNMGNTLQKLEEKLKNSIFSYSEFILLSVYTRIGVLNPTYDNQLSTQLEQPEQEEQQGFSNNMIMFLVLGGALMYIGLVFCCNHYKKVLKECKRVQQSKIESQGTLRQMKQKQPKNEYQSKRRISKYDIDIITMSDDS